MPRAARNRHLFASAIARSTLSGSTTSRRTRPVTGTDPTAPFVVGEEERETRTETSN
jgi:hypothetical protein